ncbi:4,4'-diaponeurosporenoate glycosyltransferase [Paenibacillus konkukensis]|uniref:4,4'-diaponeurosporenoate glycosyltransferase n=1 Tax=Paenibacillus konkukensis TaxID=2020716 RepID=A0ABY4RNL3_9BACL|nr:glycosyltransferase family 2 protein [Paenibacillus konkukensis]UQZ83748.1 4,4'-diaponeurosporenoate glycosyltransferase [Paenibacillus konkukensis]
MMLMKLLSIITLSYWIVMLWDTLRSRRLMLRLPHAPPDAFPGAPPDKAAGPLHFAAKQELPLVSVVIAAKEEEASITETVRHLLNQTYPRLEIIAVNDRSQDGTGRKLEELIRWSEGKRHIEVPLTVIHVTTLPAGWLGKNHALYQGYKQARGQYVLFTDADVLFAPETVADAVHYMKAGGIDHLTLAPDMAVSGFWLRAFVSYFFFTLSLYIRPWRANVDSQHKNGMGVGAFNMLTRQAYEAIGTHQAFALRPDDDLVLGKRVKEAGLRQRLAAGGEHLAVEWYRSLGEAVKGLEKNLFSGFHYKLTLAAAAAAGQLLLFLFPFAAVWWAGSWAAPVYAASVAVMFAVYALLLRSLTGRVGAEAIALPLTVCLLIYIVIRSVWLTLRQHGIYWRGTFYPLDELRKMRR